MIELVAAIPLRAHHDGREHAALGAFFETFRHALPAW